MTKIILFISFIAYSLTAFSSTVVQSNYTESIDQLTPLQVSELFNKYHSTSKDKNIYLTCLESSDDKLYIGLWHSLVINSTLKNVTSIIEDFEKYHDFFEGIEASKIIKNIDLDKWIVEFENKSPIFFIPNIHYQMEYKKIPVLNGAMYKYHLSSLYLQSSITFSDGLIFLKEEDGITKFYELDFFNANWGVLGKITGSKIWNDSVKELAISDLELKYKAENLKLSSSEKKEKVYSTLKLISEDQLIEKCIKNKVSGKIFFAK